VSADGSTVCVLMRRYELFVQALKAIASLPPDSADEAVASPPLA
jgi:hypothetical protein